LSIKVTNKKKKISIAYSPDTDDAFMVLALREKRVPWEDFDFTFTVGDIQELNEAARDGKYDITAISVGAYPELVEKYLMMPVGASIGDEFGPAVVTKPSSTLGIDDLRGKRVAVPGLNTSAHIAAQALFGPFTAVPMYFMTIKDAVLGGEVEAGILIHELQLDPESAGLRKITDLGRLWYDRFQLPLPLGANAIKRDLDPETITRLSKLYRRSVEIGLENRVETIESAVSLAAAKDALDVIQGDRYISMYVNERSLEFQSDVLSGIRTLFDQGSKLGLFIPLELDGNLSN
jgi:1,4-dihydroxy-6-naphthoate synthase